MTNRNTVLTHTLGKYGNGATLTNAAGAAYIENSFDAWCKDADGDLWYASHSGEAGRVNTIRLGEYYYDVHVRDYDLKPETFKVDKEFHVWSDRLYLQYTLFADEATDALDSFGAQIRIPENSVAAVKIRGFTRFGRLRVEQLYNGEWTPVELSSVWGYDGYGIKYEPDGTYSYSFVFAADGAEKTFRVTVEPVR